MKFLLLELGKAFKVLWNRRQIHRHQKREIPKMNQINLHLLLSIWPNRVKGSYFENFKYFLLAWFVSSSFINFIPCLILFPKAFSKHKFIARQKKSSCLKLLVFPYMKWSICKRLSCACIYYFIIRFQNICSNHFRYNISFIFFFPSQWIFY